MKTLITLFIFILSAGIALAQMPKAINYQAVARNNAGEAIANQNIKVRLSIINSANANAVLYSETRQVTTNTLGLFNLQIGSPGALATTGSFDNINWLNNTTSVENLKVELDINNNNSFVDMGTQALVTVPYAFAADQAVNAINIGGHYIDTNTPTEGQVLKWESGSWVARPPRTARMVSIDAPAITVNGSNLAFVFAHTPVEVTLYEGESIAVTISAVLGTTAGSATSVGTNVAFQESGAGKPIVAFYPASYLTVASISARSLFTVAGTKKVGPAGSVASGDFIPAGTYKIGFAVRNLSPTPLNSNDAINGFIIIH